MIILITGASHTGKTLLAQKQLCSEGYIVDAGPLGSFRPSFTSKAIEKEEDFKPSLCITKTQVLFTPTQEFRQLKNVEFHRVEKQSKGKEKKKK